MSSTAVSTISFRNFCLNMTKWFNTTACSLILLLYKNNININPFVFHTNYNYNMPTSGCISSSSSYIPPIFKKFNTKFKTTLDVLHDLECLQILPKDFSFPKIIVVGDKFVGKASIVSSLLGLHLPKDLEFPLIVRFKNVSNTSVPRKFIVHYNNICCKVNEDTVLEQKIHEIAETIVKTLGNQTSVVSITVTVKQHDVPELTIVNLPAKAINPGEEEKYYKDLKCKNYQYYLVIFVFSVSCLKCY